MRHSTNNFKFPYEERIHFSPSLNWYQLVKGASGWVLDRKEGLSHPLLTSRLMDHQPPPRGMRWRSFRDIVTVFSCRCCLSGVIVPVSVSLSHRINSHLSSSQTRLKRGRNKIFKCRVWTMRIIVVGRYDPFRLRLGRYHLLSLYL